MIAMHPAAVATIFAAMIASLTAAPVASAQGAPPGVDLIFSPPAIEGPQLSPDGDRLLFVRRAQPGDDSQDGASLVIVDYTDLQAPQAVSHPMDELTLQWAAWANNERILISWGMLSDIEGEGAVFATGDGQLVLLREVWRSVLTAMNTDGSDSLLLLDNRRRRTASLFQTEMDRVVDFLPNDPDHILLAVRHPRTGALHVHRVNVNDGRDERIDTGRATTLSWFTNSAGETVMRIDAGRRFDSADVLVRRGDGQRWRRVARQDISRFSELQDGVEWVARTDAFDEALVLTRAEGADTLGLHRYSLTHGEILGPVFQHDRYDVSGVLADPLTGRALALSWADDRTYIEVFDPIAAEHLPALRDFFGDDVVVEPLQRAGARILLAVSGPLEPRSYYIYDSDIFEVAPVGATQPHLQASALASVSVHRYAASDGTELFGYLTHPLYPAGSPHALVVLPHGGPELRDYYGFDPIAQLIAAEGLLVFQPQFRGSSGFGRSFAEAGHGEWGALIQQDISDGVRDLIEQGVVDPDRICIAGWSFGGYAALMQAILEPGLYQCAAAGAPATDLPEFLDWAEDGLEEPVQHLRDMMGYPDIDLASHSPARRADEIAIPVLLVHGDADMIVPVEQSRLMMEALEAAGADARLVEFDGGHALDDPGEMRTAMFHLSRFLRDELDPY